MPADQEMTVPPREIELKFQLMPGSEAILRADDIFGDTAQQGHQITTYHDTPDNLLFTSGLTLRIRQENNSFLQTVKSRDDGIGLASCRNEWEWPVTSRTPDVGKLAGVPQLAAIAGQIAGSLASVIVTDVWRTKRLVALDDGAAAEASLDIGTVSSGALSEPICELELELERGPVAPLYRLAIRLAVLAPMWVSAQSKAARGRSLCNGHDGGAVALPKAKIGKKVPVSAGLHQIIGALLSHLTTNTAPTLSGDPEALRQMRGALRQLRAMFRLFRPLLKPDEIARFDAPLRQFSQTLGAARDWDVFCLQTLTDAIADLPEIEWGELSVLADARRASARAAVHHAVCGPQFTRLMLDLALWSEICAIAPLDIGTKQLDKRLSKMVPALLDKIAAKANRAGRHPGRLSVVELHDFRKALDRLNVAIRFLGSTYHAHAVVAYRKSSDAVRAIIGAANDAEVTKALALELADDGNPAMTASATALTIWADQRQANGLTGLKQAARRFRTEPAFWRN